MPSDPTPGRDLVAVLQRWEAAGAVWRVLSRRDGEITVALHQCDGGAEVERYVSTEESLARFLAGRISSEESGSADS